MKTEDEQKRADGSVSYNQKIKGPLLIHPGQGSIDEQKDKIMREEQREPLYKLIHSVSDEEVKGHVLVNYEQAPEGFSEPSLMRFSIPRWARYHEVYWESLSGRLKLAVGGVVKLEYDNILGTLMIRHFDTPGHQKKPANFVAKLIAKLCLLVERGELTTDFTRWRHKAEYSSAIGQLSPGQATFLVTLLKLFKII